MKFWSRVKKLSFKQLFLLAKTFGKHPTYFFPTQRATIKTITICDKLFGKAHHQNNQTNAFRHALWNILIAQHCYSKNNSVEKSVNWAKKITDLHEKIAPNDPLEMAMDLHNNAVGRQLFQEKRLYQKSITEIVSVLQQETKASSKVSSIKEIQNYPKTFVHIDPLKQ